MPQRNFFLPLLALGLVVVFGLILIQLLLIRYERGDVYPAYSTLRADPFGTRAFYEALAVTGRYQVDRGFVSLHHELEGKPDTLAYLGLDTYEIPSFTKDEVAQLDDYVKKGGRVLITLAPKEPYTPDSDDKKKAGETSTKSVTKPDKDSAGNPTAEKADDESSGEPQTEQEKYERDDLRRENEEVKKSGQENDIPTEYQRSLAALWGFGWELQPEDKKKSPEAPPDKSDEDESKPPEVLAHRVIFGGIEPSVPWKSALYFVRLDPDWMVLYKAKDRPVFIRRHWGKGEIALATDSYFLSNEALRNDRRPLLLSLLAGQAGKLLFDESHLGTHREDGVMSLAEKFHLEGYLYGMIDVLALFLWRNSSPLVPPQVRGAHAPVGGTISGKDSRSGLVNLLRRNIPSSRILEVCLAEWRRGVTPRRSHLRAQLSEMESIVTATTDQPGPIVQSYRDLSKVNAPLKTRETHATKS